jgi:putative copper export protein
MPLDRTQTFVLIATTGVTLFWLLSGGSLGFPESYRVLNPEAWAYALAYSVGASAICQLTYIIMAASDLIRRKRRFWGWLLCSAISVLSIFATLYILPPPSRPF